MINWIINKYFEIKTRKRTWKPVRYDLVKVFKNCNKTSYVLNLKQGGNDLISRLIAKFSNGFTHTVHVYYPKDLKKELTLKQQRLLMEKLNGFYHNPPELDDIPVWVFASADQDGINYFDLSKYQKRKFTLCAIPTTKEQDKKLINFFLSRKIADASYDYTGLAGWLLNTLSKPFKWIYRKIFDKKKDWFCSELIRNGYKKAGVTIGPANPSPGQIAKCINSWKIYEQL